LNISMDLKPGPVHCPACGEIDPVVHRRDAEGRNSVEVDRAHSVCMIKNGYEIHRCPKCGLLFVPYNEKEKLEQLYHQYYRTGGRYSEMYIRDDPRRTLVFERWLNIIQRRKPGGRLLDTGASLGEFLNLAEKRGVWELFGVEIDPAAARQARKNSGADIRTGTIERQDFPENYFDVITAWEIVEHLPDVLGCLRKLRSWLKPDGLLCLSTPNLNKLKNRLSRKYRGEFFIPPEHLLYFNRRSLRNMMSRAGYEAVLLDAGIKSPLHKLGLYRQKQAFKWIASTLEWIMGMGQSVGIEGFQTFAMFRKRAA